MTEAAMIWLDKQAVDLYSRAKARFGFSDALASKIWGSSQRKNSAVRRRVAHSWLVFRL